MVGRSQSLAKTPGFALGLEEGQDVTLTDGANHVADDGAVGRVEELNANLSTLTTRAGSSENLGDPGELFYFI